MPALDEFCCCPSSRGSVRRTSCPLRTLSPIMASSPSPVWDRFTCPPIVIGGCARSGTTLLLSVLSCHSRIFAIESETFALCPKETAAMPRRSQLRLDELAQLLERADIPASCWRWCEKTPKNVRFFGPILEAFGQDIRLIHMVRDGRDVVTSVHPRRPEGFWVRRRRWVKDVASGLAFADHPGQATSLVRAYSRTSRGRARSAQP
jgi:hypothetical protein